jgi:hypothetical protein
MTNIDVGFSATTMNDLTGKCIAKENLPVVPGVAGNISQTKIAEK